MALRSAGKAFQTVAVRKRNDLPACFQTRGRVNASWRRRLRVGQYPAASKCSGWMVTKWKNSIRQAIFLRQDRLGHPSCLNSSPFIRSLTRENEIEDTTAAVLMVDKYGGKDTPGDMAVNTRGKMH